MAKSRLWGSESASLADFKRLSGTYRESLFLEKETLRAKSARDGLARVSPCALQGHFRSLPVIR